MSSTQSKASIVNRVTAIMAGIQKQYASTASLSFNGQTMTPAAIIALIQAYLAAVLAEAPAKAQYANSVKTQKTALASMNAVIVPFTSYLHSVFGTNPTALGDFGLTPRKRRAPTTKVAAEAVELRAETRKLRNTMGSRQRLDVKAVPATAMTPTASPATNKG
jgi:hypothetical protein